ncbi:cytochrome P450 [Fistulina hepatica ATCC 64428]|uniref:Cytochrome P450 n=1 Tax=Fistulina hepatica ATCC 64428 TaxID=1128425 RepID=A0A0D7A6X7_9AGAR|nr:cytochrome P450 [Fistulina hepatica ATCC 64428]
MLADSNYNVLLWGSALVAFSWLFVSLRRRSRLAIYKLPGPPRKSWIYGCFPEIYNNPAGTKDIEWATQYGNVMKIPGPLGLDRFAIADPRALQYVFQAAGYRFDKDPAHRANGHLLTGPGLVWAIGQEGDVHKRQRKVLLPGFGAPEARSYVPIFSSCASKMLGKWQDILNDSNSTEIVVDAPDWLSRATLDALGHAAFDYNFGALDSDDNELARAYRHLLPHLLGAPSKNLILFLTLWRFVPDFIIKYILEDMSSERTMPARYTKQVSNAVAEQLIRDKRDAVALGQESKDILSIIVKANLSEDPATKLSDEEISAQLRTLLIAGHETTANTLSWALLELSKQPHIQDKLRAEIRAAENIRHSPEWTWKDFEAMPYLNAVVKETLRFHDVVQTAQERLAVVDEIVPLSKPVTLTNGEVVHELFIPKGTSVSPSLHLYNMNPDIWGADADEFNPDRWINNLKGGNVDYSLGMYANLMTFSAGMRGCIGWRFAVLEMQAFLVEALNTFEFVAHPDANKIVRQFCGVVSPNVEGRKERGSHMPVIIRSAPRASDDEF